MRTNIELDDDLVTVAKLLSVITTKKELIYKALEEYIRLQKRSNISNLFWIKIWDGNLDEMREQ